MLRLMLALVIFFTIVISTIQRIAEMDKSQSCLDLPGSGEIDVNRGTAYWFSQKWPVDNAVHTLSPNGLYDAFLYAYDPQHTTFSVHYLRSKINPPRHVLRMVSTENVSVAPLWSWSSQWVIYTWNETDGTIHLSLNDPEHERKTMTIPGSSSAGISNWGFSHDDRYLALTLADSTLQKEFVFIWSVPDLILVNSAQVPDLITSAEIDGLAQPSFHVTNENLWSPINDVLILMDNDKGRISLLTLTPWAPFETIVSPLPPQNYSYGVAWSPDGQYVVVQNNTSLGAVNLQVHQYARISDSAEPMLAEGSLIDGLSRNFHWSPDGHTLVFPENHPGNSGHDLIAYDLDTQSLKMVHQQVDPSRISFLNNPHWLLIYHDSQPDGWYEDLVDMRTWQVLMQIVGAMSESPDGKTMVGVINSSPASNKVTLGWIHEDSTGVHKQTIDVQGGVEFGFTLHGVTEMDAWSSDSRYTTFINGVTTGILDTHTGIIQTINTYLGAAYPYLIAHPSPDGHWTVVDYNTEDTSMVNLTLFANDGSQKHVLYMKDSYGPGYYGNVVWSPDSRHIALQGTDRITIFGTDGQVLRTIADPHVRYAPPVWQACS